MNASEQMSVQFGENTMKKFLLGIFGAVAITAPALAADLPMKAPPPVYLPPLYNWSGFYIGANGGWGDADNCLGIVDPVFGVLADGCRNRSGGVIGGQIGYRWQQPGNHFVFGLEAQGDWANLSASHASFVDPGLTFSTKTDAIGLFTAQIGFGWDTWLWYAKAGAAVTSNNFTVSDTLLGVGIAQANSTRWGGVVGTGIEYGFGPNWSVALEYDHLMMDSQDTAVVSPASTFNGTLLHSSQSVDMITVRFNYRFGGYGAPLVARY
jgi:outer membrane immunogenic protein